MDTVENTITSPVGPTDVTPVTESHSTTRRRTTQTGTETPTPVLKPRKTRTPVVKPRTLEELDSLPAKKMSPAESALYIDALRDVITRQNAQNEELQQVAKSSFEQFRNADDSYHKIKAQYDADIGLARQIINTAAKSIGLIGGQK